MIPLLFGVSLVIFLLLRLIPGDPVLILIGVENAAPEEVVRLREVLGLDQGLHVQYLKFVGRLVRGDLGTSLGADEPVARLISERLPATIELTLAALLGISMPSFWLGVMLIFLFALRLGWLPASGRGEPFLAGVWTLVTSGSPAGLFLALRHLILPAITLGTALAAVATRLIRSSMLEVMSQDYVRTARAKGLQGSRVVMHHALRNALIPVVTVVGFEFGALLGGAVITETIFAWPGIGRLAIRSIVQRDFPVVQGVVLMIAVVRIGANLAVDVLYAIIDPRIRYS